MRVTSSMLTNNSIINMQKTKQNYSKYLEQYTTQQKISAPSDDPIIAVRSLKYRTNMSELEQYRKKNIPDAFSWMDITEGALKQVNSIMENMYGYANEAASDSYNLDDRQNIIDSLKQYKEFIYKQQLNADYAGRYVFAGYRTDTPMVFDEPQNNQTYSIVESIDISTVRYDKYIYGGATYAEGTSASQYAGMAPELKQCHKVALAYNNLDSTDEPDNLGQKKDYVTITYTDSNGVQQTIEAETRSISESPQNIAYDMENNGVGSQGAVFVPETGEIVFGEELYDELRMAKDIEVKYNKTEFTESNVRPEHYFDCDVYDHGTGETIEYRNPDEQNIEYQINFSQMLKVNTLGSDSISLGIGRMIDKIVKASDDLTVATEELNSVNKRIEDTPIDAVDSNGNNIVESLTRLKDEIETEITLKTTILQESFGNSLTGIKNFQNQLNTSLSDLGARYKRLQMTEAKLDDLQVSYEELLSENEDVDIGEAYIKYTEADLLYQTSLSATSKVLGNLLLDFI